MGSREHTYPPIGAIALIDVEVESYKFWPDGPTIPKVGIHANSDGFKKSKTITIGDSGKAYQGR